MAPEIRTNHWYSHQNRQFVKSRNCRYIYSRVSIEHTDTQWIKITAIVARPMHRSLTNGCASEMPRKICENVQFVVVTILRNLQNRCGRLSTGNEHMHGNRKPALIAGLFLFSSSRRPVLPAAPFLYSRMSILFMRYVDCEANGTRWLCALAPHHCINVRILWMSAYATTL